MTDFQDAFSTVVNTEVDFAQQKIDIIEIMKKITPVKNTVTYTSPGYIGPDIIHQLQDKKYVLSLTYSSTGGSTLKITNPAFANTSRTVSTDDVLPFLSSIFSSSGSIPSFSSGIFSPQSPPNNTRQ